MAGYSQGLALCRVRSLRLPSGLVELLIISTVPLRLYYQQGLDDPCGVDEERVGDYCR